MIRLDVGEKTFKSIAYKWTETECKNENNNNEKWIDWAELESFESSITRSENPIQNKSNEKRNEKKKIRTHTDPKFWMAIFFLRILISIIMSTHPNNPTEFRY